MRARSPWGVELALQTPIEIDGTHDAVAEFFVDQGFEYRVVNADEFIER